MPPVRTVKHETDVIVPRAGETYVADDGTVSQVLDDHIDANYEPTEEEVLEFADWIGMKLPKDAEFLWLAREGLKTPLPKEWKPCSTNDGDIYYFNFKTGESSWDHPMDDIFRQRFEQEKEKTRACKPASAASNTAANRTTSGPNSRTSNSTPVIQQTHVIITDTGVLRRDPELGVVPGPSPAVTSISSGSKGIGSGNARSEVKPIMHYPPQQQPKSTVVTTRTTGNRQSAAGSSTSTAAAERNPAPASTGLALKKVGAAETSSAAPPRIVSEAERALEERVQREMQLALEAERSKIEEAHQGTMSTLQLNFDKDVAEMRSADTARRAASLRQEEEERERRLQQTRSMCEDSYGDELRTLEREAESYATKLQKLDAEASRATSGNTQRAAIEAELKMALSKQLAKAEADATNQHNAVMEAARSAHAASIQKAHDEAQGRITAAKQARQRKFDEEERALAMQAELQRKQLDAQMKEVNEKLTSLVAHTGTSTTTTTPPATDSTPPGTGESLSERLTRIAAVKAAQLQEIEATAAREQSAVRTDGEAALAELTKQVQLAQQASQLPPAGATPMSPLSRATSYSSDRSGAVALQGGARPTSAILSLAFSQELNRIRLARSKDRQERLAKLRADREAALEAIEVLSHSTPAAKSCGSDTSGGTETTSKSGSSSRLATVEKLKVAHAVELEAKKAAYAKMEEDLKQRYACEAADAAEATTLMQQNALVAKAVDTEMDLYIQQLTARYDRMRAEAAAKSDKALSDHQLAMEAYERRKREAETRQAREQQEAQEAFIQSRLDAAVAEEKTKLAADHAAAMTRLTVRYDEERDAVKAEVEEEMAAYEAVLREEMKTSAGTTAAPGDKTQGASAPAATADTQEGIKATRALCSQVEKQHADRYAEWMSRKLIQAAQRAELVEKQAALQAQKRCAEQHVEALKKEIADLAAAVQTAGAQQHSSFSASTPSRPVPASTSASMTTAGGHLRSVHEASMQALEQGYRSQEAALEAELQTWRGKIRALQQSPLQQSYVSTNLSTPLHQVLANSVHSGSAAMRPSSTSYVLHRQPSPIPAAAAGASLLNTPMISIPLEESPWKPTTRFGLAPLQIGTMARGLSLTTGVPGTAEVLLSYQQRRHALQERQASLETAREAWQLQRRRKAEFQQQEQSRLNLSALTSASQCDHLHEVAEPSILGAAGGVHRNRQELLSRVLSHLIERLDGVMGQAVQLQYRHGQQRYSRSQSATRSGARADMASSPRARANSAHCHHHNARGPPEQGSVTAVAAHTPRHPTLTNAAADASSAKMSPPAKRSSFSERGKAAPSVQHSRSGNSGGASPGNALSKWSALLSQNHRHRSG
ncbi:hypothetical protein, conserved [Leishmania tarentolae]|uniref:WW domain-containing protein n=1 Tax=Leishmania tarentolae TaxID=5689 RepID=A0A640KMB7_LEITA|nr:hypothetical protein, conserved [Leishmania tarentolae]